VIVVGVVQLVTFELSGEEYGVDIRCVNSIIKSKNFKIFKIPNSSNFLEGVINLRGKSNPIVNLKKKFNFEDEPKAEESKIVIINNQGASIGFIVDEVTDILKITDEEIEPVPNIIKGSNLRYLSGIVNVNDKMISILDLVKLLSVDELEHVSKIATSN
jgi:purine-binding chemotaxis protein CheW